MDLVDVALLFVYGFVVVYFLRRFTRFGKLPSLGIALLPLGWIVLACSAGLSSQTMIGLKWIGVVFGVLLIASVTHADRAEK